MSNKKLSTSQSSSPQKDQRENERLEAEEYEPHKHRNVINGTSTLIAFVHMLKGIIGTGIFAMPKAFSRSGYVVGIILGVLIGVLLTYCIHVLVRCQYILCKRHREPVLTYQMSFKLALEDGPKRLRCCAPYAIQTVNTLIVINQIGLCAIYIIFAGQNIRNASEWDVHVRIVIVTLLGPLILLVCIRNLRYLAPFSTLGNIITVIGVILIFTYVFQDIPSIGTINPAGDVLGVPQFFGTYLFALVAIGVVSSLENKMQTPKSFGSTFGVVNCAMVISVTLYIIFGFFGYWKYGAQIQDTITLNLPNDTLAKVIQSIFAISVFASIGIQFYVAFEIIWRGLSKYFDHKLRGEFIVRVLLALFIFALAVSTQQLGTFISFIGALCMSLLALAFPALIEICVVYPDFGRFKIILIRNIIIIIISVLALITGVAMSIADLIPSDS